MTDDTDKPYNNFNSASSDYLIHFSLASDCDVITMAAVKFGVKNVVLY